MKELDVLFIHPPRRFQLDWGRWGALGLLQLPLGLPALANLCVQEGFDCRILDIPLELSLNPQWSLDSYLRSHPARVYAIDLHWFATSYGAIATARRCKALNPGCQVLLGGFTASFYAEEILRSHREVDAIIEGEAEKPLLAYLRQLEREERAEAGLAGASGRDHLRQVPNLTYRTRGGGLRRNQATYLAGKEELNSLNFADLSLLEHAEQYLKGRQGSMPIPIMVARGCPFSCPFCAGSRISLPYVTGRRATVFRDPGKVAEDITLLSDRVGRPRRIFMGHGLYRATSRYWMEVFREVRRRGVDTSAEMEVWRLPAPRRALREFARTFDDGHSYLAFSLHSSNPEVRRRLAAALKDPTHAHTQKDLQDLLALAGELKLALMLWLTLGSPFERSQDLARTLILLTSLARRSVARRPALQLFSCPITPSPGSPVHLYPSRFQVKLRLHSFADYYRLHRDNPNRLFTMDAPLAYETESVPHAQLRLFNTLSILLAFPSYFSHY